MASDKMSYRASHAGTGYGLRYRGTYERGYYAAQWRSVEGPLLAELLQKYCKPQSTCLDFACGTGRISRLAGSYFKRVVGVDVSEAMLSQAVVPTNVSLRQIDLTREALPEKFGTALAFRFFLNAEPALRIEALTAIRAQLLDGAPFIMNIHMTRSSPLGVLYRILKRVRGRTLHPTDSPSEIVSLLEANGFVTDEICYYGYLPRPGHYLPQLCEWLVAPIENICRALYVPRWLCQSFIVVAHAA